MSSVATPRIAILTGAGMSAESGISTFRDSNGLWENHNIQDVASPEGWSRNPELVNTFYNARRAQLNEVEPNPGHTALVDLEDFAHVDIITQNVDDLHERAGSSNVLHLHGELRSVRNERGDYRTEWKGPLSLEDACPNGNRLRPDIVWFGEDVPNLPAAADIVAQADILIVIGTSMQVYPAAGLVGYAPQAAEIYYVDPKPTINYELGLRPYLQVIESTASQAIPTLVQQLRTAAEKS